MKFSRNRFFVVLFFLFSIFIIILGRAFSLQILPNDRLKTFRDKQFQRTITLQPTRGIIVDRNNIELASSITAYSLFADPSILKFPKKTAIHVAKILDQPIQKIYKSLLDKNKRFVWIERKMSKEKKEKIEKLNIRGLGFVEESKRIYPNHNLLSQTLGFVGEEGQGLGGLEFKYNEELSGEKHKLLVQRDARGRPLLINGKLFSEQPDGSTLQLTIDSELQYVLEQELKKTVEENEAESAVGVILEAHTNEILALSSVPDFDPNNGLRASLDYKKNRTITDPFEPGSVMKTFVVAGGLKEGLLEPNTKYFCENGSFKVADRTIKEASKKHQFGWLTVSEILAKSSNIGMVKIGFQLGAEKTKKALEDFGFGQKTGVPLGGESRGIFPEQAWTPVRHATISFGQGIATTALQMANAYATIANGGVLKEPLLVKAIINSNGDETKFQAQNIRKVLTEDQAKTMLLMLMGVTQDEGTAQSARVQGFPVAGKTGTAQKANPDGSGYLKGAYTASFAGIIPAQDPRYIIYIAVDHPKKKYYGAEVAAPVFARVAGYAIRRAGMSPILLTKENLMGNPSTKIEKKTRAIVMKLAQEINQEIPQTEEDQLIGLSVREVMEKTHGQESQLKIFGNGQSYKAVSETLDGKKTLKVYFQ